MFKEVDATDVPELLSGFAERVDYIPLGAKPFEKGKEPQVIRDIYQTFLQDLKETEGRDFIGNPDDADLMVDGQVIEDRVGITPDMASALFTKKPTLLNRLFRKTRLEPQEPLKQIQLNGRVSVEGEGNSEEYQVLAYLQTGAYPDDNKMYLDLDGNYYEIDLANFGKEEQAAVVQTLADFRNTERQEALDKLQAKPNK